MVSPELLVKISSSQHDERGRECDFYKMSATRGLKVYQYANTRDQSYYTQLLCWMFGLGPEPFETFSLPINGGEPVFCYVTELIPTTEDMSRAEFPEQDVKSAYRAIQAKAVDACNFNCGKLGDKIVMLDFGDVWFGQDEEWVRDEKDMEYWYNKLTEETK